jgi:hypothetical protein
VAVRQPNHKSTDLESVYKLYSGFHWSHIEATGEIQSAGETEKEGQLHGASYTEFLLRARPDLTSVLGIYVNENGFRLAFSNACGVAYMKLLKWENESAAEILCAWISRLYNPFEAHDTDRIVSEKKVTFKLRYGDNTYKGCKLLAGGTAFGRRTTIFEVPTSRKKKRIIKDQYIELERRFSELEALTGIHGEATFPGVVRFVLPTTTPEEVEPIVVEQNRIVRKESGGYETKTETRKKTRLMLVDRANPLVNAKTPQEALIAIYDLLEGEKFGLCENSA